MFSTKYTAVAVLCIYSASAASRPDTASGPDTAGQVSHNSVDRVASLPEAADAVTDSPNWDDLADVVAQAKAQAQIRAANERARWKQQDNGSWRCNKCQTGTSYKSETPPSKCRGMVMFGATDYSRGTLALCNDKHPSAPLPDARTAAIEYTTAAMKVMDCQWVPTKLSDDLELEQMSTAANVTQKPISLTLTGRCWDVIDEGIYCEISEPMGGLIEMYEIDWPNRRRLLVRTLAQAEARASQL